MPAITAALRARIEAIRQQFAGDMENYASAVYDDDARHAIDDGQDYGMTARKRPDWMQREPGAWEYVSTLSRD